MSASAGTGESALERALVLLRPELRPKTPDAPSGYLDLLGADEDLESTGVAQDLMQTRFVPAVYERYWRPFLGRIAKGVRGPSTADEHRIARLLLGLVPGDGVLDVACGPGNFARDFARAVEPAGLVVGLDASATMLARGVKETHEQGIDNLAFIRGDAAELPFKDDSFDAVSCLGALHLFGDPFRALDRMTDVLTPGGRIAIFASVRSRTPAFRAIETAMQARSGVHMFGEHELTGALETRGFTDIRQQTSGVAQFVGARLAG